MMPWSANRPASIVNGCCQGDTEMFWLELLLPLGNEEVVKHHNWFWTFAGRSLITSPSQPNYWLIASRKYSYVRITDGNMKGKSNTVLILAHAFLGENLEIYPNRTLNTTILLSLQVLAFSSFTCIMSGLFLNQKRTMAVWRSWGARHCYEMKTLFTIRSIKPSPRTTLSRVVTRSCSI